jgi:hypothetical protein
MTVGGKGKPAKPILDRPRALYPCKIAGSEELAPPRSPGLAKAKPKILEPTLKYERVLASE